MFKRDNEKPKEQRILVLKTGIAGVQYHFENDEEAKEIVEKELRRSYHAPTENMAIPFSVYMIEEA